MKKKITALAIIFCVATTSLAFARGNDYGNYGGHHNRSDYHRGGGHRNDGLGIAVGVVGGLLLGSALMYSAGPPPPPPPTVVYSAPYPPEVVVQQPRICVEDRVVDGQWQISRYDGRRVWVSFPYPVSQRVQVPCY